MYYMNKASSFKGLMQCTLYKLYMPSTSLTSFDSIQPIQSAHFFLAKKNVPIVLAEYYQSGVIHHKNQMEKDIKSNVIIIV